MRKRWAFLLCLVLAASLLASGCALAEKTGVNIAVLKGPTGMGAAPLMAWNEAGETDNAYAFTIAGAPYALTGMLITGELDMAALPTNVIALLAQKSEGAVQALAVNTLGVLYVMERGESVQSIEDLAGTTVVSAGQGTPTEAVMNYLLGDDVQVTYVAEHAEAVSLATAGEYDLVLLPEPFVTSLLKQDDAFRVAVDVTAAWEAAGAGELPMGGIAVRTEFAREHPEAVAAFLEEYAKSVAYANENPADAAQIIEQYDIMQAAVAQSAIPRANMVCLTGEDMKAALEAFYAVLADGNAALIGGAMPDESFYYAP